jgi:ADP-ribose pyrophosphatase YjhB (NUDIX family)
MYKELFLNYIPKNEQEKTDLKLILDFINHNQDALFRTNLTAHVTSSAFVVNQMMDKILFAYHNIYDSWAWVGGHNDGNPNLLEVAMSEAMEETGVKNIYPFSKDIFTVDVIYVKNHIKNNHYVPDHLHLNASFLLIADESDQLLINEKENSGVKWFDLNQALSIISEDRMKPVYEKAFNLIKKLR